MSSWSSYSSVVFAGLTFAGKSTWSLARLVEDCAVYVKTQSDVKPVQLAGALEVATR
jgi:hypothetical protein